MRPATQARIDAKAREIMAVAERHKVNAKYVDIKAVAAEMGLGISTIESYKADMVRLGWGLKFTAKPERFAPKLPPSERPLNAYQRATLRKAEQLADARGMVDLEKMAEAFGVKPGTIASRASLLKGRGWRWVLTNTYETAKPAPEPEAEPGPPAGAEPVVFEPWKLAESAEALAVLLENRRAMRSGRGEVDDPPFGIAPRSGKDHKAQAQTPAEACRSYLREWRRIKRGLPAKAEPKPQQSWSGTPRDYRILRAGPCQTNRGVA